MLTLNAFTRAAPMSAVMVQSGIKRCVWLRKTGWRFISQLWLTLSNIFACAVTRVNVWTKWAKWYNLCCFTSSYRIILPLGMHSDSHLFPWMIHGQITWPAITQENISCGLIQTTSSLCIVLDAWQACLWLFFCPEHRKEMHSHWRNINSHITNLIYAYPKY